MRPRLRDCLDESTFYSLYNISKLESMFLFMEAVSFTQGSNTLLIEDGDVFENTNYRPRVGGYGNLILVNHADGDFLEQINLHLGVRRGLSITIKVLRVTFHVLLMYHP